MVSAALFVGDVVSTGAGVTYNAIAASLSHVKDGAVWLASGLWSLVFGGPGSNLGVVAIKDTIVSGLVAIADWVVAGALWLWSLVVVGATWMWSSMVYAASCLWSLLASIGGWVGGLLGGGGSSISEGFIWVVER